MQSTQQRRLQVLGNHLLTHQQPHISPNQTCGIIAVVAHEPVSKFLLEGLKILEARGYDSAGISTVHLNSELITTKHASKGATNNAIELLAKDLGLHGDSSIGIAHTRWATHGGAADHNAHPHLDQAGRIAVVHNGVIENYAALKTWLKEEHQVQFRSETDTEVIAQLIGIFVKSGKNVVEATQSALAKLEGTWGLVVLDRLNPSKLVVAKNGSPMLIGIGSDKTFVSSESVAFSRHTKEFIALEDNEIAVLTPESHSLELSRIRTMEQQEIATSPAPWPHWTLKGTPHSQAPASINPKSRVQTIEDPEVVLLSPEPFSSWTEREIMEQPESLSRALNYGGRLLGEDSAKLGGLSSNQETIENIKHLVIAACGTSLFAGLFGSHLMHLLDAFETVQVIDAAEIEEFHLPSPATGGMLVISQSGETKDVHRALVMAQEKGLPVISVVNAVGSLIARSTSCGIYLNAGRENAVASTKAFTSQATVLALLGLWFSKHSQGKSSRLKRKAMVDALHRLPTSVGMTTTKDIRRQCRTIAERLFETKCEHLFVLGKGACMPIAYEGALKIKEISYVHAEGYAGGALKHGPFALIEPGTPIIFLMIDDNHAPKMRTAIEEVTARGAYPITITNIHDVWKGYSKNMGDVVYIPSNGVLTALLAVIPLQFIAYELSVLKGINPDRPRHLAKTVTVD